MKHWLSKIIIIVSFFTIPFSLAYASDANQLITSKVESLLKQYKRMDPDLDVGIAIASLDTGQIIYEYNAQKLFTPASNAKLFTVTSALYDRNLGPGFQFNTVVRQMNGDLYFVFDGDPTLTSDDIFDMVKELKRQGVHTARAVYIDHSRYAASNWGAGWMINGDYACYAAPASAIVVNRNCGRRGAVRDLSAYVAALLRYDFRRAGIRLESSKIADATSPADAKILVDHKSEPLSEIMIHMMKHSDNVYANSIFKKMGQKASNGPGDWQNSETAEKSILQNDVGLNTDHMSIHDGSGLSVYTKVSPSSIIKLLRFARSQWTFKYLYNALPISGVDGTLRGRMLGRDVRGRVHAKTGSMTGVSSLSGYLLDRNNHMLAFSIIMNGFSGSPEPYRGFEDRLVTYLTQMDIS